MHKIILFMDRKKLNTQILEVVDHYAFMMTHFLVVDINDINLKDILTKIIMIWLIGAAFINNIWYNYYNICHL